jgi:hypothetical protein
MAANEIKWIWNSPSMITLEPGESKTSTSTGSVTLARLQRRGLVWLVNLTIILATYNTPEGEQHVESLFPDAPYPTP